MAASAYRIVRSKKSLEALDTKRVEFFESFLLFSSGPQLFENFAARLITLCLKDAAWQFVSIKQIQEEPC